MNSNNMAKSVISETAIFCKETGNFVGWKVIWNTARVDYVWLHQDAKAGAKTQLSQQRTCFYSEVMSS